MRAADLILHTYLSLVQFPDLSNDKEFTMKKSLSVFVHVCEFLQLGNKVLPKFLCQIFLFFVCMYLMNREGYCKQRQTGYGS